MGINRGIEHLLAQVNPDPTIKLSTHFSIMLHCVDFRPRYSLQILRDVIVTTLDLERLMYRTRNPGRRISLPEDEAHSSRTRCQKHKCPYFLLIPLEPMS